MNFAVFFRLYRTDTFNTFRVWPNRACNPRGCLQSNQTSIVRMSGLKAVAHFLSFAFKNDELKV